MSRLGTIGRVQTCHFSKTNHPNLLERKLMTKSDRLKLIKQRCKQLTKSQDFVPSKDAQDLCQDIGDDLAEFKKVGQCENA